jgi:anti-sigma factor RsiW
MATVDHATIQEWLHRELDDDLAGPESQSLRHHLTDCADCRAEQRALQGLNQLLTEGTVAARSGFQEEVMAALPPAAWEARTRRAWRLPLALLVALMIASALLMRGTPLEGGGSVIGIVTAVADLFAVALVTGAGLLGHSWQGMRMVFQELLSGSATGFLGLAILLVGLNSVLFLTLRRRARVGSVAARRGD